MTTYLWGYAFVGLSFIVLHMYNTIQRLKLRIEELEDKMCLMYKTTWSGPATWGREKK